MFKYDYFIIFTINYLIDVIHLILDLLDKLKYEIQIHMYLLLYIHFIKF